MLLLALAQRQNAMHGREQLVAGEETERVADVDDGVAGLWSHVLPLVLLLGREDLQAPLLAEQECQRPNVGVFVVPAAFVECALLWVAEHGEGRSGGLVVAVRGFETGCAGEVERVRKGFQHRHGDEVRVGRQSLEESDIFLNGFGDG